MQFYGGGSPRPHVHETPLDFDVDYAAFSVFINISESSAWFRPSVDYIPQPPREIEAMMVTVSSLTAAYEYLR